MRKIVTHCIGFGASTGKCKNDTCPESTYWCTDCERERVDHLNRQFDEIANRMGLTSTEHKGPPHGSR